MAAFSDYLKTAVLNHIFRQTAYVQPTNISIALTTAESEDTQDGSTISEVPTTIDGNPTGYVRINLGAPDDGVWEFSAVELGLLLNSSQMIFDAALVDWGAISGVAILDSSDHGTGNLLMHATLENARLIYSGDRVRFDSTDLEVSI